MKWWKSFADPAVYAHAIGPRRRQAIRYPLQREVRARTDAWGEARPVELHDVSAGGLYLIAEEPAERGERIEVELAAADGVAFRVAGEIVNVVGPEEAVRVGRWPGLGVKLDALVPEAAACFRRLVDEARAASPQPGEAGGPRPARPSAVLRAARDAQKTPLPGHPPRTPRPHGRSASGVIAIDLGNAAMTISALVDKRVAALSRLDGKKAIPAVVAFPRAGGRPLAGAKARAFAETDPAHAIEGPKRLLGRRFDDPAVQEVLGKSPWQAGAGPDGALIVDMWGQPVTPIRAVSVLLAEARELAEEALGERVSRAVLTVPVTWEQPALEALRAAAELAALEVVALVDEPTSAVLAHRHAPGLTGLVGVLDLGAREARLAVLDVSGADVQVLAAVGNDALGGDDLDQALATVVADRFRQSARIDLEGRPLERRRLRDACEKAKRQLVWTETAVLSVNQVLESERGLSDLHAGVDRATLVQLAQGLLAEVAALCRETLGLAGLAPGQLTAVILAGGTNHLPVVWQTAAWALGAPPLSLVPPELTVCLGAGVYAAERQILGSPALL